MKKTLAVVAGAAIALGAASLSSAQPAPAASPSKADVDKLVELVRKDVRAQRSDIVAKTMKLDAAQATAFWPVYKAYEAERQAVGNQRLAVIQDLAEHFDTLNDAKAKGLLERSFAIEEQRLALEKKYKDELLRVLPAKTVARFFQVESRLNNLINLEISSAIPLVN
jgi:Spy/CpxP family protein refolding chaperone